MDSNTSNIGGKWDVGIEYVDRDRIDGGGGERE